MSTLILPDSIASPLGLKPKLAIGLGFFLLFAVLFFDYISPHEYRVMSLYIFPVALIALNARSMSTVIVAVILATAFENYTTLVEHDFTLAFTQFDLINLVIRLAGTLLIVWLARSLRRSQLRANLLANTDSLTSLWNRRWARITLDQEIARLSSGNSYLSVALIDLNDFKKINDTRGHLVGDEVLVRISQIFLQKTSSFITFFRLGGDEFLVVMRDMNEPDANHFLNALTQEVDSSLSKDGFPVTLSIGSVTYQEPPASSSDILHQVDLRMYEKKLKLKGSNLSIA